ncbi:chromate efflux transporter [Brevibacillus daliensis]|uniref:chromate efflux transporter n=1 Tax=Brevibacillus daliensis TaxID=2892995 RepID=UPI001E623D2F|nr:chromate efflux transporter [Brevibacillus daliensis]
MAQKEIHSSTFLIHKSTFRSLLEVLLVSTKLGLTSFGGPIAHLGYFHNEYIQKRKWMDERSYADLVALCQFLPGPVSSQVGIGIGIIRAGYLGGLLAWIGFTLPSLFALILFAFMLQGLDVSSTGWIHGLKIVAVVIVAQAVLGMGQKLTPDRSRATLAILSTGMVLSWQSPVSQIVTIILAGLIGIILYKETNTEETPKIIVPISRKTAVVAIVLFFALLLALPLLRQFSSSHWILMFDSFYRSGALVFGGGHVVLPLLEQELVSPGWISSEDFLAGYGATQAVPGPLFTFAGYLGALIDGLFGATIATIAIFLPAFLLVIGVLPFWNQIRQNHRIRGALVGIQAAVVGILLAALYDPLWTTTITSAFDFVLVSLLFVLLVFWKTPPWIIVLTGACGGILIQ